MLLAKFHIEPKLNIFRTRTRVKYLKEVTCYRLQATFVHIVSKTIPVLFAEYQNRNINILIETPKHISDTMVWITRTAGRKKTTQI